MNNSTEFLPFHAINEFMRPDFRLTVIRDTLINLDTLSEEHTHRLDRLTRKWVKVPGFRNSEKAPVLMKVVPMVKAFEKSPDLVAAVLAAWTEENYDLASQVYHLLKTRDWSILDPDQPLIEEMLSPEIIKRWPVFPINFDRTRLPGFFIKWPKGEDYEKLYAQFIELYPDAQVSIDKVSLMIVWLSLRLPYQMEGQAETPLENLE